MTDNHALFDYLLRLGDNSLILGQRLAEWCGHAPILEEELALTNIGLDLMGQSRLLLTYAAEVEDAGRDEDMLAFHRDTQAWRNLLLLEQPNGDFAKTMRASSFLILSNICSSKVCASPRMSDLPQLLRNHSRR